MKYNHKFCSICEIVEDAFCAGPQKTFIFYANHFIYVLQKRSRNKLCLESHDTYCLFRMFFSLVNNKTNFVFGRLIFGGPVIPLVLTGKSLSAIK